MLGRTRTTALPARLLLAAGLLALPACAGDSEPLATDTSAPPSASAAPSNSASAAPTVAPTTAPTTAAPASPTAARGTVTITYAGGKVTPAAGRTPVATGDAVTLTVTSDVADEVHVHGYDKYVDVAPGAPATLSFTANIPGIFEVELEKAGVLLTRLQVQ